MRSWAGEHRHSTVTTAQFRKHAARFAPESEPLDDLFTAWLDRPALPPLPKIV
jgi:hypothetical protein